MCISQIYAAQVQVLGYSTKAQTQLGLRFLPFPGPSTWSGVHLITSLVPAAWFPGCAVGAPSQVCRVSLLGSSSLAATLRVDVNLPESQEVLVSNWEPAHSLVEDAVSGAKFAPCLLALAGARLPPCLQRGMDQSAAS